MKRLLITDKDLDGVACAVLARLQWGDECDIEFIAHGEQKALDDLVDDALKTYDEIYVCDLHPTNPFDNFSQRADQKLVILDHHSTEEKEADAVGNAYFRLTIDTPCATALFWDYLHPGEPRPDFVEAVNAYDCWLLNDPLRRTGELLHYLLRLWGRDMFLTAVTASDWENNGTPKLPGPDAERQAEAFWGYLRRHYKHIYYTIGGVYPDPDFLLFYCINYGPCSASDIGLWFFESVEKEKATVYEDPREAADIVLAIINPRGHVSLRSHNPNGPDVRAIAEKMGGGGHKHAAGYPIDKSKLPNFTGWLPEA